MGEMFTQAKCMKGFNMTKALLLAWVGLFGWTVVKANLPVSFWFAPGTVMVEDAPEGVCNPMTFDREINREFHGVWKATILKQLASGGYTTYRIYNGSADYRPENLLPEDLDLCWWLYTDQLYLPPGKYRLNTLWRIDPENADLREVRRTSNTFEITEAGD